MSRPLAVKGAGACSKHVLNTRLKQRERECAHASLDGIWSISVPWAGGWQAIVSMSGPSSGGASPIRESDPLPPEERLTLEDWRSDVETLYRKRADHLIRHFTSATSDRETAREVVQEAFAKFTALSFARRLIVGRPDAYLYRICVNLLRDRKRAQPPNERFEDPEAGWHSPFAELEHRDTLRRLEAAMLRLKPKTREIFLAKRLDGMSYAEIAERTGLSVKGVEKHMSKAIAMLDRAMEHDRP